MTPAVVEFDFEEVVAKVQRAHSRANRDDAEEAVQVAVAERLENGERLTTAHIVRTAKFRLIDAMRRRERGNSSLDAAADSDEDHTPRELAREEVDFDSHIRLREIRDNPVLAAKLRLAEQGMDREKSAIYPTGAAHWLARYSDEQVEQARALRAEGRPYAEVAELVEAPQRTVEAWVRGEIRRLPSSPGWTAELVLESLRAFEREEGRRPGYNDAKADPRLPSVWVCEKFYGSWAGAVEAAGFSAKKPPKYSDSQIGAAIERFVERFGRTPRADEWRNRHGLPGHQTVIRRFGTCCGDRILAALETAG